MINGIIIVDKEKDMTSRDVVNSLCHIFHTKKIGHSGTLDPLATGVLVCLIGKYTKLVPLLTEQDKEYVATMRLGITTDTYDITGKVLTENGINVSVEEIKNALEYFHKSYNQEVPIYSSVKINGQKLYEYARNNQDVNLPKRMVDIKNIEPININNNDITFKCLVSKGTYIRSLINDIGIYLKTGATMTELRRTKQGKFSINDAKTLEEIRNNNYKLLTIEDLFDCYKENISSDIYEKIRNGQIFDRKTDKDITLYYYKEELIAVYKTWDKDNRKIKPYIIF